MTTDTDGKQTALIAAVTGRAPAKAQPKHNRDESFAAAQARAKAQAEQDARAMSALTAKSTVTRGADDTLLDALLTPAAPAEEAPTGEVARLHAVRDNIRADLEKARARAEELDESRADVVLNGGDIHALHRELGEVEQTVKTLEAGLGPVEAMLQKAEEVEAKAALERQAEQVKAEHVEAYAAKLRALFELTSAIECAGHDIAQHHETIMGFNERALQQGREDIVVNLQQVRSAVNAALGGSVRSDRTPPTRSGETDEEYEARIFATLANRAKARRGIRETPATFAKNNPKASLAKAVYVERAADETAEDYATRLWASVASAMNVARSPEEADTRFRDRLRAQLARALKVERKGESDHQYQLRVANQAATAVRQTELADPLRAAGEKALIAIQTHAFGFNAHQRHRSFPRRAPLQPNPIHEPHLAAQFKGGEMPVRLLKNG